jgi:hypothetical protein
MGKHKARKHNSATAAGYFLFSSHHDRQTNNFAPPGFINNLNKKAIKRVRQER